MTAPQTQKSNNEKIIAIVQLARAGDIIQTCQAVGKNNKSNIKLILIARHAHVKGIKFLTDQVFDQVITFDFNNIFSNSQNGLQDILKNLTSKIEAVNNLNIDVLVNLTFSRASNYLSSLIKAHAKIGPYYDNKSLLRIDDDISQFIYSNVLESKLNPYSLVDLFKKIIGPSPSLTFEKKQDVSDEKVIVIHPFASDQKKSWRHVKWSELIYKTLRDFKNHKIYIVGSQNDQQACQLITNTPLLAEYHDRIQSTCGRYDLEQVFNLLENAELFIGHDSMVSHLAALQQTKTLIISLGPVRPHETTAYNPNAYVIAPKTACFPCTPTTSCEDFKCHADISYQLTSHIIGQLLNFSQINYQDLKEHQSSFHLQKSSLYRVEFTDQGLFQLSKISEDYVDTAEFIRGVYRILWSFLIFNIEERANIPRVTKNVVRQLDVLLENIEQYYELSSFGKKYSLKILEELSIDAPELSVIKAHCEKIDEIDKLTDMLKTANQLIAPIINYGKIKKANLPGDNLAQLAKSSYLGHQQATNICNVLKELITTTLEHNKRTALTNQA